MEGRAWKLSPWQTCPQLLCDLARSPEIGRVQVMVMSVREHHMRGVALVLWSPVEPAGPAGLRSFLFRQAQSGLIRQKTDAPLDKLRKSFLVRGCHGGHRDQRCGVFSWMSSVPHAQNNNWNVCCLLHSHMFVIKVQLWWMGSKKL